MNKRTKQILAVVAIVIVLAFLLMPSDDSDQYNHLAILGQLSSFALMAEQTGSEFESIRQSSALTALECLQRTYCFKATDERVVRLRRTADTLSDCFAGGVTSSEASELKSRLIDFKIEVQTVQAEYFFAEGYEPNLDQATLDAIAKSGMTDYQPEQSL